MIHDNYVEHHQASKASGVVAWGVSMGFEVPSFAVRQDAGASPKAKPDRLAGFPVAI